jgi:hypothetical protein
MREHSVSVATAGLSGSSGALCPADRPARPVRRVVISLPKVRIPFSVGRIHGTGKKALTKPLEAECQ